MEKLSKLEIIEETIEYYSKDVTRRAVVYDSCSYNTEDGRHCAVGRCLLPKYKELGIGLKGNEGSVDDLLNQHNIKSLDDMLEDRYHGYNHAFWVGLQTIHDISINWSIDGLSNIGLVKVEEFKALHS